jgi:ABC-type sugar transport system substrate-binding protein
MVGALALMAPAGPATAATHAPIARPAAEAFLSPPKVENVYWHRYHEERHYHYHSHHYYH